MNTAQAGVPPKAVNAEPVVAGGGFALFRFAGCGLMASLELLILWQARASQRRHLSMMDHHGLRDVGLRRADLVPELRKPFWRA
jgi:uncharacterized protein YjiS (DUF1127 family)